MSGECDKLERLKSDGAVSPQKCLCIQGIDVYETYKIDENTIGVRAKWISVEHGFPSHTDDVLVIDDRGRMAVSCYFKAKDIYVWEQRDDQIGLGEITHWMPLPKKPEKVDVRE